MERINNHLTEDDCNDDDIDDGECDGGCCGDGPSAKDLFGDDSKEAVAKEIDVAPELIFHEHGFPELPRQMILVPLKQSDAIFQQIDRWDVLRQVNGVFEAKPGPSFHDNEWSTLKASIWLGVDRDFDRGLKLPLAVTYQVNAFLSPPMYCEPAVAGKED